MLWYLPWSESIKKRACRYLLQRYLGNFLEEKLTLDQLSVDLYNGTGTVSDVSLDCEALNELGDAQNWPLEIVDGHMAQITVSIPWSTLLKDDCNVTVRGLCVTVQPKLTAEPVSGMLESMWSSMSSSMQLAEECLREEDGPQDSSPVEGIEMFAHAIDSILSRVKVIFVDTKIRIEHVPKNGEKGIALELHIQNINYFDEAGVEPTPDVTEPENTKTYIVNTYTNKKIQFHGVTLYTDEYPSKLRTMARSLIMDKSQSSQERETTSQIDLTDVNYQSALSDVFYETKSVLSTIEPDPIAELLDDKPPSEREATPEEKSNQPDPILFAKLTGQQELSLKMKHTEEVEGPKVEVKMLLGSFVLFLSPRQLHTLIELVDALKQPDLEDRSNIPLRGAGSNMQCKPMKPADFQLIEAQLLGNLEQQARPTAGQYGWTGGNSFDDSDAESERFHPMTSLGNQMTESTASSISSSATSSVYSQPRVQRSKKVPHIEGDPTAEVSHISVRVASISCVLLHKDIVSPAPISSECISPRSAAAMQAAAQQFFEQLMPFSAADGDTKDFAAANQALDNVAAGRNHLRLLTSEMTMDGSEKVTCRGSSTVCEASIQRVLVTESLSGEPLIHLIRFHTDEEECKMSSKANIRVSLKQTLKYATISGERRLMSPTTDISMKCTPLTIDMDLTVIDRLSEALVGHPVPASVPVPSSAKHQQLATSAQTPLLTIILRFPIADLRPGVSRDRRRVRPDYLQLCMEHASLSCHQHATNKPLPISVSLNTTTMDLYYYENESLRPTHIARSTMSNNMPGDVLKGHVTPPMPTISLTFQPRPPPRGPFDSLPDEEMTWREMHNANPMTTSMYIMNNLQTTTPSPFSGKKTAHQTFTQHEAHSQGGEEELIVPGSAEEMAEFTSSVVQHSDIHLDLNLPIVSLQLESKQLYEILYNRINSDLLLWEPGTCDQFEISPLLAALHPAFTPATALDSDSDSSSSEEDNLYYSTYDNKLKRGIGNTKAVTDKKEEHNFCLTLKIGKGLMTIYAPVRDSNKRVVPGQMGELVLEAQNVSMCNVSGLHGRPKTAQMCMRASTATLYHDSLITIPAEKPSLRVHGSPLPANLKTTIYPSGPGVIIKDHREVKDMFTLGLRVEPDCDTPNLKTICISLGIEAATLRHRGDVGIAWLTQLMDVIDVLDYPVPGYTPSTVLSELHVHVCECSVDYRPLYLPIRTVVTLGSFAVSSNIIAETNTSSLRFLAQECTLFLSHLTGSNGNAAVAQDDDKLPDVRKDYICVVDVGLFELSLRMEDRATTTNEQPLVDLSASNNMVTLYTCWDSASALCRLLTYAASDGDSLPPPPCASRHASICEEPNELGLFDRPIEEIRELSPSEIQQVNDLMAEALKESPSNTLNDSDLNSSTEKEGVEIFFFPDESNVRQRQTSTDTNETERDGERLDSEDYQSGEVEEAQEAVSNAQVVRDLGDPSSTAKLTPNKHTRKKVSSKSSDGGNTDDEFCIVESEPYSLDNDLEEPAVNWFGAGPVHMIDNHFTVPAARTDVLKAPKSFPQPMLRYTLCEMSITWNMYGGNDFKCSGEVAPVKKSVTIQEDGRKRDSPPVTKRTKDYEPYESSRALQAAYRQGVSWAAGSDRVRPNPKQHHKHHFKTKGGVHRDHHTAVKLCLTKLKFIHEVYQPGLTHASRQTLAISKIEVLDRLVNSDINKLLSQYKLKDEPDRKNAHMVVIKAVHLRPLASLSAQECCLKVSILPLRFNLDQDTLAFLVGYASKLGTDQSTDEEPCSVSESGVSRQTTPTHRPPVMSVGTVLRDPPPTPTSLGDHDARDRDQQLSGEFSPLLETYEAERMVSENLIQLEEDFHRLGGSAQRPAHRVTADEPADTEPLYFRRVVFSPEVPIRLDYVGKRVDLSAGPVAGLLMGLGQLNCSELTLKRLDHRLGLLGLEKLIQWALHEWLSDIKRHQLPGLLSGIGPMHSLLQLITGIRDLVWLPVEQWRRDGRLVHGLRRGAASFTARTAVAALDITTRILQLIQATAETAFDMLSPGPTLQLQDVYHRRERRRRRRRDPNRHPHDLREGIHSAYNTVREGFAETATTMAVAARDGSGGAVLRHLPGAAVTPLALAAAGAADVLGGVRAHLAPNHCSDTRDKWRANH